MVLSNKRLKQKLRDAKAKLIFASEADQNNLTDKNSGDLDSKTLISPSSILNSEAQNLKLSKREKRRQRTQKENPDIDKTGEISGDAERNNQDESKSENAELKKKKNKRKRDESEVPESVEEKKPKQLKKKKNAKKKKKKSKKKVPNEKVKEETVEQSGATTVREQIVAKIDASIDRKDVELSDKVYVGGIPYYSTEDDIRSYFEGCGTITFIDCMTFPDTGKFRGIAIITFKTEAAAKRALALDGSDMGGLFLKIQPFKSAKVIKSPNFAPSVMEGYNRIYIGNLSWDITENDLRKLFIDCTITSIRFGEDKESGEFKGYAHVDFADSLSLNTALRLDQKIVCGRPVKISCAVPKKGTVTNGQVGSGTVFAVNENHIDNSVSSQIRRRTCYECGEKGHITSSCPKKQEANSTNRKDNAVGLIKFPKEETVPKLEFMTRDDRVESVKVSAFDENNVNNSKIRRQTFYECGEKGHLSSACPKKQEADSTIGSIKLPVEETVAKSEYVPRNTHFDGFKVVSAFDENNINNSVSSSKIRRRTCYECGEKGHLSSACPKKQEADSTCQKDNAVSWMKSVEKETVTKLESMPRVEQVNISEGNVVASSKIKRRNCYECGEKGHLSSSCPKKQAADSTNPSVV